MAIYLDLAKAFDTINHTKLVNKLQKAGIRSPLLNCLTSYLSLRTHRVKINGIYNTQLTTEYGVPQGSVLGPLLFITYINDLHSIPLKAEVITFADDTTLLYRGKTEDEIRPFIDHDMQILLPWFRCNLLHLNAGKCKCMVFACKTPEWVNTIHMKTDEGEFERVKKLNIWG
jgi:hypothetical protein